TRLNFERPVDVFPFFRCEGRNHSSILHDEFEPKIKETAALQRVEEHQKFGARIDHLDVLNHAWFLWRDEADFAERIKYPLRGKQRDKAPCLRHRTRPGNPMRDEAAPGQPQDIVLRHDDLDLGIAAEKTSRAGNGNIIAEVDHTSGKRA